MNSTIVDIDITPENPVTLIPLSDLHIGHAEHDKKLLADTVKFIKQKGAYSILVGDLIDAIAMQDRRYENDSIHPDFKSHLDNLHHEQCKSVIKSLSPIKKQILGTVGGNHEATLKKMASYDAVSVIAEGLEVKQLTDPSYIILRFRNGGTSRSVRIWLSHGCFMGGGKFRGSKVNNLEQKSGQFEADIYLSGHTHDRWVTSRTNMVITDSGVIKENRKIERYSLHVPIVINALDSKQERLDDITTRDISSGGVFIESGTLNLDPGSKVHVEMVLTVEKLKELFKVSNKVILEVDGLITRATSHGIAVKFTNDYSITPLLPGVQSG